MAWGFPPSRSGGVYRALATARAFADDGWAVTVLTATRETFEKYTGSDPSLEELIDDRIDVVRVPFDWPALDTDIRQWSPVRAFLPRVWWQWRRRRDVKDFPEVGYGPWRRRLERAAASVHAARPVDLVVASANPNVDFMAADHLHRTQGVPYVMDYRDAWSLDVFNGREVHPRESRVGRLESALVTSATEVWFVNEPIHAWHAERYPDARERMHVVANGYDSDFAPHPRLESRERDAPLTFGYIGTVSAKVPISEFVDGWVRARSRSARLHGASAQIWGYLGFYAAPNPALLDVIESHADSGLSYAGPLPKQHVASVYETFDCLLLILGAGRYVTSGKVFEYLASALPIVSVHDPGNAVGRILAGYPLWFPVTDLSAESVARVLEAAAAAAREATPAERAACRDFARDYSRDRQLVPRVHRLREHVTGGGDPT
ncbi:glycosyl transferase [Knoellia aerolata]|uniref:Glycosyl transferase n=1 Tax=Knoellia aerolata DSM 18566 TaxID=1385519 RepID=A0A0A0JZE1_9MICO|nr:glycosyl transferase [Knoellia aerolata]KGN40916.1 glycosyl transferase [Knoellia aerolata DSM 18566]